MVKDHKDEELNKLDSLLFGGEVPYSQTHVEVLHFVRVLVLFEKSAPWTMEDAYRFLLCDFEVYWLGVFQGLGEARK